MNKYELRRRMNYFLTKYSLDKETNGHKENIDPLVYSMPCEIENEQGNIDNLLESIISLMKTSLIMIT
jgi:hypothetical protein